MASVALIHHQVGHGGGGPASEETACLRLHLDKSCTAGLRRPLVGHGKRVPVLEVELEAAEAEALLARLKVSAGCVTGCVIGCVTSLCI